MCNCGGYVVVLVNDRRHILVKFGHCYFLCDFFMRYAVIINYFGKKCFFQLRETGGKQLFCL